MTSSDFIALLEKHDWYYDRSDDNRAYAAGAKNRERLLYICQQQPELFRLYNQAESCVIRGVPFDFQTSSGNSVENENHTKPQTCIPDTMKEVFTLFFDICVKPLVDAINNLAATSGVSAAPAADKPAPAEKPAKAAKAAKPAPAPEPEPASEETEAEPMSEGRLRETVKTLTNEGKMALKAYFVKAFGYNTMAEIEEKNRAAIHAKALELGATDTDPDAIGDM